MLRFDYDGTGDSAGHDEEPDRIGQWIGSIHYAADELRSRTDVTHLCFLGIRFGATLACLAAVDRNDVSALVAVAPIVAGKAYVRELRMLQLATNANQCNASVQQTIEAAGYILTQETQRALSEIDLMQLQMAPAKHVLILDRSEMPSAKSWKQSLRHSGCHVDYEQVAGYAEMMLDAHDSVVPEQIIDTSLTWLTKLSGTLEHPPFIRTSSLRDQRTPSHCPKARSIYECSRLNQQTNTPIEEFAVHFGRRAQLFGIITTPRPPCTHTPAKAVVLLNSGAIHRIGPGRLYVCLARHLARHGKIVLRMDIAGIGDSAIASFPENIVYPSHAINCVQEAVDYLRKEWGATDISAAGICSGAYHAFRASVAGLSLSTAMVINPLTFYWEERGSQKFPEFRVAADISRYRTNLLRLSSWGKLLTGGVDLVELAQVLARRVIALTAKKLRASARVFGYKIKRDLPTDLVSAVNNGTKLHFVFSSQDPGMELLQHEAGNAVRRLISENRIGVQLIEGADHTFTRSEHRKKLITILTQQLTTSSR